MYICIYVDSTGALGTASTDYAELLLLFMGSMCSAGVPCVFMSVLKRSSINALKCP